MANTTLTLDPAEVAVLFRAVNGQGGLQTLLRTLQGACNQATGDIVLTDAQLGRIVRHLRYGPGGFEGRLRDVFARSLVAAINRA